MRIEHRHQSFIACNREQCERCLNFRNRIQSPFLLGLTLYHSIALLSWNPPFLGLLAVASAIWGRGKSVSGKKRADFQLSLYLQHMYLTTYEKFEKESKHGKLLTRTDEVLAFTPLVVCHLNTDIPGCSCFQSTSKPSWWWRSLFSMLSWQPSRRYVDLCAYCSWGIKGANLSLSIWDRNFKEIRLLRFWESFLYTYAVAYLIFI